MPAIKKIAKNIAQFILFLGVGLGILYFVYSKQQAAYQAQCALDGIPTEDCNLLDKVLSDFAGANFYWLGVVVLAFVISNFSRAARWKMLLKPMGYTPKYINLLFSIFIGYFANLGLPRLGELIRATTLAKYEKLPVEKVVGTIVVDRVVDMLSFLVVFAIALVFESDTLLGYLAERGSLPGKELLTNPIFWGLSLGFVGLLVYLFKNRQKFSNNIIYKKISNILKGLIEGIKTISKLDNIPGFLFHSVVIWLMYYLMTYLCFNAFAPTAHLGPQAGLLVFVFASLGMIVPSPGGMGTYHAMVVAGLSLYGIDAGDSFSFANIIFFAIQIFGIVILGLVSLVLMPIMNRDYQPKTSK
ncbi:MAG TPA: flippase-like domain-containing protein [Saprospiraceae bacterium]|nr:flippase-like domain-containing protein [Saprospiraceae bacterium]